MSDPPNGAPSAPPLTIAADGLPMPPGLDIGAPPPVLLDPVSLDNCVCLRGPCQHYWELRTSIDHGNAEGTFEALDVDEPELDTRRCTIQDGIHWDLADTDIFSCNKWSPMLPTELVQLSERRKHYFKDHPEHRPEESDDA